MLRNLLESPFSDWGKSPSPAADDFLSSSGDSASASVLLVAVPAAAPVAPAAIDGLVAGAPPIAPDADAPRSPASAAANAALLGDVTLQPKSID